MKYSKEQRLLIGREISTQSITISQAANKCDINPYTARAYMRENRDINGLEPMSDEGKEFEIIKNHYYELVRTNLVTFSGSTSMFFEYI